MDYSLYGLCTQAAVTDFPHCGHNQGNKTYSQVRKKAMYVELVNCFLHIFSLSLSFLSLKNWWNYVLLHVVKIICTL